MNDRVSEIFGYIVMAAAAVLFVWERVAYNKRNLEDAWLLTRRRYVRRSAVSAALAMIGILLVLESVNLLDISLVVPLTLYVLALCGLAILLLILAMVDLADTTRTAQRKTLHDLETEIEREKLHRGAGATVAIKDSQAPSE